MTIPLSIDAVMRLLIPALAALFLAAPASAACDGRLLVSKFVLNAPLCVPTEPRRIVALDPTFSLGMSMELGLPVVGAPLFGMSDKDLRAKAEAASIADLGGVLEPSIEMIVAAAPDLIIGSALAGAYYDMLAQIAPTALVSAENWRDYFSTIAEVTGRAESVAGMFDAYDKRVRSIRERMPDVTVSVVRITAWDLQVYVDGPNAYAPFSVLREAGARRSNYETVTDGTVLKRPSWEDLAALDGDILLYIVGGRNNSDTSGRLEEVLGNPLWQMLPAAKANRVHRVDVGTWMEFSGLASANKVLDDIERYILKSP